MMSSVIMSIARSVSVAVLVALNACGGSKSEPAKPEPAAAASAGDVKAVCIKTFTRARECSSDFIPALVDARARHDVPPGIAAKVKENRDAVIAEGMKEWEADSTDDAIAGTCDKISADPSMGTDSAQFEGCLAKTSCPEFVACAIPVQEKHFAK
jgi:hypothetical protein